MGSRALRTSSELLLVGEVILVELDGLLLLLLVVDGVCTGCGILSALTPLQFAQKLGRSPPCPEGILKKSVGLVIRSSVCRWEGGEIWSGVENVRRSRAVGKGLDARKSGMRTATELWRMGTRDQSRVGPRAGEAGAQLSADEAHLATRDTAACHMHL